MDGGEEPAPTTAPTDVPVEQQPASVDPLAAAVAAPEPSIEVAPQVIAAEALPTENGPTPSSETTGPPVPSPEGAPTPFSEAAPPSSSEAAPITSSEAAPISTTSSEAAPPPATEASASSDSPASSSAPVGDAPIADTAVVAEGIQQETASPEASVPVAEAAVTERPPIEDAALKVQSNRASTAALAPRGSKPSSRGGAASSSHVSQRNLDSPTPETLDPGNTEGFKFMNVDPSLDAERDPFATSVLLSRPGSHDVVQSGNEIPAVGAQTPPQFQQAELKQDATAQGKAVEVPIDRKAVIAHIRTMVEERERVRAQHASLQTRLVEYFKKKTTGEDVALDDRDNTQTDQEMRYATGLNTWQTLEHEFQVKNAANDALVREIRGQLDGKSKDAQEKEQQFRKSRRQIAQTAVNSKTGKPIPSKTLEQLEVTDQRKNADVTAVVLENIKLRNRVRRSETLLRQREELADGLHLIDFEQLKIENQTFIDKIEERTEEVNKLKAKITVIVQTISHIKEKMYYTENKNVQLESELSKLDAQVSACRDRLPMLKVSRDQLRKENEDLQHQNGLRGRKTLLRDYENKMNMVEELETKLKTLRARYETLAVISGTIKKKTVLMDLGLGEAQVVAQKQ